MLGIDPHDVRKYNITDVLPENMMDLARKEILPKLRNGGNWKGRYQYRNLKTGNLVDVNAATFTIDDRKTDKPIYFANVSQDITSQIRAEAEKKKVEAQLLQSQKLEAVGTLAVGIAHDFNNILFPIIGLSEMLLEGDLDKRIITDLMEILKAGKRARDLVARILTFSRKNKKTLDPVMLEPLVKEAIKFARSILPTYIHIKQKLDLHCGAVMADAIQFHQIMMNLITNAFHSMENSGGILLIVLQQEKINLQHIGYEESTPKDFVCLNVEDTGAGMDSNAMHKIFQPGNC